MKKNEEYCFMDARIPAWLGHRFEGVHALFPDYSPGQFFCTLLDLGCDAMIKIYDEMGGDE